ncbi:MAG: hypothetical protein H8K10_15305 [Nitrospira sp.]|nr:hypothetical protein [Nitrospira sp.]
MPSQCLDLLGRHHVCRTLSIASIVLSAGLAWPIAQVHGSEWGDVPAIKGLDFSKVEIYALIAVQTRNAGRDTSQLYAHTMARLAEQKLAGISPDPNDPKPLKNPRLIITLLAKGIPDCPDKLLYVRNLELRELAVREREPKVYTDGISFGGTDPFPEVIEASTATAERFEQDLDQMIDRFAQRYWEWNGKSSGSP